MGPAGLILEAPSRRFTLIIFRLANLDHGVIHGELLDAIITATR